MKKIILVVSAAAILITGCGLLSQTITTQYIYVANLYSGTVSKINLTTGNVSTFVSVEAPINLMISSLSCLYFWLSFEKNLEK